MSTSRRKFLRNLGGTVSLLSVAGLADLNARESYEQRLINHHKKSSLNDTINVAVIGMGIIGFRNARTIQAIPNVKIIACCDLYTGRLERAREVLGKDIFITRDYHEIISRKDIDAVIICTSDNWHQQISIDAMRSGKAVYCEKPVIHKIEQGQALLKTQEQTKAILQVGSQRVSSIAYAKAKELYKAGEIGELNCVEASFDRQSALGAWQYTMPLDANEQTVDWKRYTNNNGSPFNAQQFFRWRNYKASEQEWQEIYLCTY